MGEIKAKIGSGAEGESAGNYGSGERNSRGDCLAHFSKENDFVIANTFCEHHTRCPSIHLEVSSGLQR